MRTYCSRFASRVALAGLLALLLSCGIADAGSAQSSHAQIGNVVFQAPRGWKRLDQVGDVILTPARLPKNEACLLVIIPGQKLTGSFRAWFTKAITRSLSAGEHVVKSTGVQGDRASAGYSMLYTVRIVADKHGKQTYRFYFGAHPGDRVDMVLYFATSRQVFQRYQGTLLTFLNALRFTNLRGALPAPGNGGAPGRPGNTPPQRPTPTPPVGQPVPTTSGLNGLYVAEETRNQFNPATGYYDYIITRIYYLFTPDGHVHYGLPTGGLDGFDFGQAAQTDPANTGTYVIGGDGIEFRWANGSASTPVAFSDNGASIQVGHLTLYRVGTFTDLRIDGIYTSSSFVNTSGGGTESGVSGQAQIAFNSDGSFSAQGFSGYAGSGSNGGGAASSTSSGSGTYSISGNTLTLTYSGGTISKLTFLVYPGTDNGTRPGLLIIDRAAFLPQD